MERQTASRRPTRTNDEQVQDLPSGQVDREAKLREIDDILDGIDEVLEDENDATRRLEDLGLYSPLDPTCALCGRCPANPECALGELVSYGDLA